MSKTKDFDSLILPPMDDDLDFFDEFQNSADAHADASGGADATWGDDVLHPPDDDSWQQESAVARDEESVGDEVSFIADEANLISADEVELAVTCEIGQVRLSLKKLMQLKVGDSLEFMRWPGKVKLRVNSTLFAEGYLVEVNGLLGVKITNKIG